MCPAVIVPRMRDGVKRAAGGSSGGPLRRPVPPWTVDRHHAAPTSAAGKPLSMEAGSPRNCHSTSRVCRATIGSGASCGIASSTSRCRAVPRASARVTRCCPARLPAARPAQTVCPPHARKPSLGREPVVLRAVLLVNEAEEAIRAALELTRHRIPAAERSRRRAQWNRGEPFANSDGLFSSRAGRAGGLGSGSRWSRTVRLPRADRAGGGRSRTDGGRCHRRARPPHRRAARSVRATRWR